MKGLTANQIARIKNATEEILENTGVVVMHEGIHRLLKKAGARVDDVSGNVKLPRQLLRELIEMVPKQYSTSGSAGQKHTYGGGSRHLLAIVTDPWIVDYDSGDLRRPCLADIRRHTQVAQQLERVAGISLMDYPVTDCPGPESNLRAMEEHLLNHDKHLMVLPTSAASFDRWLEIGKILLNGRQLKGSNLMTIAVPILSPMRVTGGNVDVLLKACQFEFPIVPTTCPMAGTTAPYSKAGTLLAGNVETVFMMALTQVARPGTPYKFSIGQSRTDMRNGEDMYYTLDKVLWKIAGLQLGKSYGVPVGAECGGSMQGRYDLQSGAEGMLFMLSAYSQAPDLLSGIGSFCNALGMSGEMMLVHTAWLAAARFLCDGIDLNAHLGLDSIQRVGPGGHYMDDEMTLELLRSNEFFNHELFDHGLLHEGQPTMLERAHRKLEEMTREVESPLPGEVQENLRRFFHAQCVKAAA